MKYFAKYLPVKGDKKTGDTVKHKITGDIGVITKVHDQGKYQDDEIEKVKLFLCTRDIQIGDKVEKTDSLSKYWDLETENDVKIAKEREFFKVIGEISERSIWIKEGDVFEEEEIYRDVLVKDMFDNEYYHYHPKGNEKIKLGTTDKFISEEIKIKGPCGHFH